MTGDSPNISHRTTSTRGRLPLRRKRSAAMIRAHVAQERNTRSAADFTKHSYRGLHRMLTPNASPVAEINLDQSSAGNGHGPPPTAILSHNLHGLLARFCRSNLHRSKTRSDLLDRSRLPPPGEYHACRNPITARDLGHLRARHQRLFDDPNLVVLRPASSPL